ncbi:MAG: hypothetical protein ACI86M_001497 [Saprospiraceae bacterium]|jgi:hypothetical protein
MRQLNSIFKYAMLLALLSFSSILVSQSNINETSDERSAIGITESKGYNFVIIDGALTTDSISTVIRKFNIKGYRTETAIYNFGILSMTYQFEYANDTLLVKMKTFEGPVKNLVSESGFEYDKNHNLKKKFSLLESKKYDFETKNKYNNKGQLVRSRLETNRQKLREDKFKYNDHGKISEKISSIPSKERFVYTYDDSDRLVQLHKVFKNGTKSLIGFYEYSDSIITKHKMHDTGSWLGVNGIVRLNHSDVLTTETILGVGDQVLQETEYLNGKINGFRKYYYN